MFYAKVAATASSFNVTITSNGCNSSLMSVRAGEFSGIAASSPLDTSKGTTNTGNSFSPGTMTVITGDLVCAVMSAVPDFGGSNNSFIAPSGWTIVATLNPSPVNSNPGGGAIYRINPTSPTNPNWALRFNDTYTWTGSQFGLLLSTSTAYTLTANDGTFTETGEAATFTPAEAASNGSFVETGEAVGFGVEFSTSYGSFVETGVDATLDVGLTALCGSFVETGVGVTFLVKTRPRPVGLGGQGWYPPAQRYTSFPTPSSRWRR